MKLHVEHNPEKHQFFTVIENKLGTLDYDVSKESNILDYKSTFVPEELRGRQIGGELVRVALEYAKNHHFKVIPSCPFVKQYINRHPEYQSIVAH